MKVTYNPHSLPLSRERERDKSVPYLLAASESLFQERERETNKQTDKSVPYLLAASESLFQERETDRQTDRQKCTLFSGCN
jgi:hypothetical protein